MKRKHGQVQLAVDTRELAENLIDVGQEKPMSVFSDPCSSEFAYSTGNSLWGASYELIRFIQEDGDGGGPFCGQAVELGAGSGAVSLVLWMRGAAVLGTDVELGLMQFNIDHNTEYGANAGAKRGGISTACLEWKDHNAARTVRADVSPGLIVGAELSYDSDIHADLIETLLILTARDPKEEREEQEQEEEKEEEEPCVVLLAVPHRDEDRELITTAKAKGFNVQLMKACPPTEEHASEVGIYKLVRRSAAKGKKTQ
jgi:predicted nicotinamide N-methyase